MSKAKSQPLEMGDTFQQVTPLSFGIVGAGGYWGPNWVRVLDHLGVLAAVCDKDLDRLDGIRKRLAAPKRSTHFTTNYDDLLTSSLDAIFVITEPDSHEPLAVKAMRAGKHVFIEKPLAETQEQCYRIKFEAERLNRIVMVGHTFVYHPAVRLFKRMLREIGDVRSIYTVRGNFGVYQSAGLVYDLLPHDLSIFTYLCEGYPTDLRSDVNPTQDVAYVSARYGSVSCSAFLSWSYPEKTRRLIAVGSQGILEWDLAWSYLHLHHKRTEALPGEARFRHFDNGTKRVEVEEQSEPLMNQAIHFIECIRNGMSPTTGVEDGINVVRGLEFVAGKHVSSHNGS